MWREKIRHFFGVYTPKQAEKVKLGLAIVYAFVSWHLLSFVFLHRLKVVTPTVDDRVNKLAKMSGMENIKVIRIGGKKTDLEDDASKSTDQEYSDLNKQL